MLKKILRKIFSVKTVGMNKVICFLGIKIKIPRNTSCCFYDVEMLYRQNTNFPHPLGIVVATNGEIGKNCTIYQNVTIGAKNKDLAYLPEHFPKIGNNVTIYAGACVVGGITIGDNVVIGANAVVTQDVPENSYAVGNPVKIIQKKETGENIK